MDVQVTYRTTSTCMSLSCHFNTFACIHTRRYFHLDLFTITGLSFPTTPAAVITRLDQGSYAPAFTTGHNETVAALTKRLLTGSSTRGASLRSTSGFKATAMTARTLGPSGVGDTTLGASNRVQEGDGEFGENVAANLFLFL